jgi:predicted metal-dependent HD superfamily phosphohydrolase
MKDLTEIQNHVFNKLKNLPDFLAYHVPSHTLDVLTQCRIIAAEEHITSAKDLFLLQVSALYHDTGFIYNYSDHEEKSCELAREELPRFGLHQSDIDIVCGMIMATKIPQNPKTILEQIICDADLDYLGRPDFYTIGNGLYKEFLHLGIVKDELSWNQLQIRFLESHHYFTHTSKAKREKGKQQHLDEIKEKVALVG